MRQCENSGHARLRNVSPLNSTELLQARGYVLNMNMDTRQAAILLLVLAVIAGLPWLVGYLRRDLPTPQQACIQKCSEIKRDGYLVYRGPATPKDKTADLECECR